MKTTTILDTQETLRINGNHQVKVTEGVLWVTYCGDSEDYFYRAGESIQVSKDRPALIEALEKSSFEIKIKK